MLLELEGGRLATADIECAKAAVGQVGAPAGEVRMGDRDQRRRFLILKGQTCGQLVIFRRKPKSEHRLSVIR